MGHFVMGRFVMGRFVSESVHHLLAWSKGRKSPRMATFLVFSLVTAIDNYALMNFDIKALNYNSLNLCCSSENYDLKMDAVCNLTVT
jgi:hypothetical protein